MMNKLVLSVLAAAALSADSTELQSLKAQMAQMEAMMKAMQAKIDTLESTRTSPAPLAAAEEKPTSKLVDAVAKTTSGLDLSLILDASYVSRSKKDEVTQHLELPGVAHGLIGSHSHDGHDHATYNASNGFNLNYAELAIHSTVDPYLDANAVFHFSEDSVEIEEAYVTTRALPYNFRARGGKFLSDFGRLNNQHHHAWNFSDMPLVYEAFLGNHGINEIGAQLQWVAPTSNYLMVGFEALQGKNEAMFGQAAINNPSEGYEEEILAGSAHQPSLLIGYVKTSADIGDTTILAGASIANGKSRIDHFSDETPHAFAGESDLYGLDLTVKHYFDSYSSLTWQSEWLYRDMEGTQFSDPDADVTTNNLVSPTMHKKQSGYYTQLVYAPDQTWKIGARYDNIYRNDVIKNGVDQEQPEHMDQYSAMIEYNTSEFARYRLQYTHSNALFDEEGNRRTLDSLIFSINVALGTHAAHSF
ncbi:MAG: hypothetical protein AB1763_06235 [Campylobacterota bacterium]